MRHVVQNELALEIMMSSLLCELELELHSENLSFHVFVSPSTLHPTLYISTQLT
jgi:hypothetical protein